MIPVIDVFAGPGGLNEGFSSVRDDSGARVFQTVASIEMEASAVETLRLRSAIRILREHETPRTVAFKRFLRKEMTFSEVNEDSDFKLAYKKAIEEVHQFELSESSRAESDLIIKKALGHESNNWVLIGGPPCQAYSLAGRSRRTHDVTFEDDHKHFLYKEYLHIIETHKPTIFVMENVKGLLSSVNRGTKIFDLIRRDLAAHKDGLKYDLYSMVKEGTDEDLDSTDFLIRSEEYGVPQKRHRLIVVGVRRDSGIARPSILKRSNRVTVADAIGVLPKVRSTISRRNTGDLTDWTRIRNLVGPYVRGSSFNPPKSNQMGAISTAKTKRIPVEDLSESVEAYQGFVRPDMIAGLPTWNHEARAHMAQDLLRYGVLSLIAKENGGPSPKVRDLDRELWPNHRNIDADVVPFADRFRVQVNDLPSTTIVSHIAKDGHYYIHPDPDQMRSLTVREAARLQTFPDDYIFLGNRTQQFTQVGNAVPPLLAKQIGEKIAKVMNPGV
ncbi:DNA (cytosine-5-)-methyltransferase [Arthrobacter livingstonensis]|uniref:DNA (cytosine-5-)-methyltransferase n=1 Tax=Arthrobacter livingstonensis TaxID=670078 RepID=A0A2V5L2K6_9MICC|nr:DNA cytosine methyltransferase [Arthrobacter livingstonensis]PYI65318.1 DNA (cytosine-5-)-methyltransferase [Arthrobacter livingstonensis]